MRTQPSPPVGGTPAAAEKISMLLSRAEAAPGAQHVSRLLLQSPVVLQNALPHAVFLQPVLGGQRSALPKRELVPGATWHIAAPVEGGVSALLWLDPQVNGLFVRSLSWQMAARKACLGLALGPGWWFGFKADGRARCPWRWCCCCC